MAARVVGARLQKRLVEVVAGDSGHVWGDAYAIVGARARTLAHATVHVLEPGALVRFGCAPLGDAFTINRLSSLLWVEQPVAEILNLNHAESCLRRDLCHRSVKGDGCWL